MAVARPWDRFQARGSFYFTIAGSIFEKGKGGEVNMAEDSYLPNRKDAPPSDFRDAVLLCVTVRCEFTYLFQVSTTTSLAVITDHCDTDEIAVKY